MLLKENPGSKTVGHLTGPPWRTSLERSLHWGHSFLSLPSLLSASCAPSSLFSLYTNVLTL